MKIDVTLACRTCGVEKGAADYWQKSAKEQVAEAERWRELAKDLADTLDEVLELTGWRRQRDGIDPEALLRRCERYREAVKEEK